MYDGNVTSERILSKLCALGSKILEWPNNKITTTEKTQYSKPSSIRIFSSIVVFSSFKIASSAIPQKYIEHFVW